MIILIVGGQDSTQNALSLGITNILRQAGAWDELRATPALVSSTFEEMMRFEGPIQARVQRAIEDITWDGMEIARGEKVFIVLGAANRDPAQFANPDTLQLDRSPNPHLGFFGGIHYCIGAPLARVEATVVLQTLLARMPDLQLTTQAPTLHDSYWARGYANLPIHSGRVRA